MKKKALIILFVIVGLGVQAQNERKFVREGNNFFMDAVKDTSQVDTTKYIQAETEYRKALEKKPNDLKWDFNLSDAIYKQKKFEESVDNFDRLAEQMEVPIEKARAYHNKGNSELMQQKFDDSIESYKKALRLNPTDMETKYNLAYAQLLKKKQEEQQQKQDQDKDQENKDQDQNKDQDKDQQNKDQDQNKDKQNQDQQNKQDQKDQQKKQQPQQNKISKENAEQLLQALQNDESKIQDKVKKAIAAKAKKTKVEKDW